MPDVDEDLIRQLIEMDVDALSETQLTEAKKDIEDGRDMIAAALNSIKSQIDLVNERRIRDATYADPNWWRRLNGANRSKGWQRQRLQDKLGEVNRRIRALQHQQNTIDEDRRKKTTDSLFVQMAKLYLPSETYQKIWDAVEQIARQQKVEDSASSRGQNNGKEEKEKRG